MSIGQLAIAFIVYVIVVSMLDRSAAIALTILLVLGALLLNNKSANDLISEVEEI